MKNIRTFGKTDVGMVREKNEDNYIIFRYKDMAVVCVADGMGGHTNGQLASGTVVKTIKGYFDNNKGKEPVDELVESSILLSKKRLDEFADTLPQNASMGTTCTMGAITKDRTSGKDVYKVTMGHIGDSKLYHISGDDIVQRSTDHTMLQKMIDANALSREEIENYPHKNIIYKSIGTEKDLDLDPPLVFNMNKGDMLLLCSDGLSGYLTPEEMLNIIKGTKNMKSAAQYMINLAKYRGGDDNITVVFAEAGKFKRDKNIKLHNVPLVKRGKIKKSGSKKLPALMILITLLLALAAAIFFVLKNDLRMEDITGKDQKQEVRSQESEEERKFEARSTKSETNTNDQNSNYQNKTSSPLGDRGAEEQRSEKDKKLSGDDVGANGNSPNSGTKKIKIKTEESKNKGEEKEDETVS